jgi:predicted acetyltransferase
MSEARADCQFGRFARALSFQDLGGRTELLVSIRDVRSSSKDRQWIESVYGEYLDSLSDLNTGLFSVIGADNPHQDELFANWFSNDQAHPLVISKGVDSVGFALVTRPRMPSAGGTQANYRMSEFFIRKPYRRSGIGREAATLIFDRFAGDWEIVEYQRHPGSVAFWRRVLGTYCRGDFSERSRNGEIQQRFHSRPTAFRQG